MTPPSPPVVTGGLLLPDELPPLLLLFEPLLELFDEPDEAPLVPPLDPVESSEPLPLLASSSPLALLSVPKPDPDELAPLHPSVVAPASAKIPMTVAIFIVSSFRPRG
jgi:hypothetical protein